MIRDWFRTKRAMFSIIDSLRSTCALHEQIIATQKEHIAILREQIAIRDARDKKFDSQMRDLASEMETFAKRAEDDLYRSRQRWAGIRLS